MKITFLLPSLDLSGGNRVIAIYADMLQRMGHHVCAVVPPARPAAAQGGWERLSERLGWRRAPARATGRAASHFDSIDVDLRWGRTPGVLTNDDVPDADVVVATWWETAEWALRLSASKGAKVHFIQHHEVFEYLPLDRVRAVYRAPLARIVIADWLKQVMQSQYGASDCALVPNAVDHSLFCAPPRGKQVRPTLGFLYSTTPFKRFDLVLDAIKHVRAHMPEARIMAFGHPAAPSQTLDAFGIDYVSKPTAAQITSIYSSCDVWLMSSDSEGFGLPAMEAMACRTPVVSTQTGWAAEAITNGSNGYLVPVGDAPALAARALDVLRMDESAWRAMSDAAFATTLPHSWGRSASLFEEALVRAAGMGGAPRVASPGVAASQREEVRRAGHPS